MCTHHAETYSRRRAALLDAMAAASPAAVAVIPAAPVYTRNNDVEHEYRQDSDFFYLTGFDEPESVAVLDAVERKFTLFVRPRDKDREVWDGPRAGVDGAKALHGADEAFVVSELDEKLPSYLQNHRRVYYRLGVSRKFDDRTIPDQFFATFTPGLVAGLRYHFSRSFTFLVRGRVHYLLYNVDQDRSLGYWELNAGIAYDF